LRRPVSATGAATSVLSDFFMMESLLFDVEPLEPERMLGHGKSNGQDGQRFTGHIVRFAVNSP
jgi:hypothetical protein